MVGASQRDSGFQYLQRIVYGRDTHLDIGISRDPTDMWTQYDARLVVKKMRMNHGFYRKTVQTCCAHLPLFTASSRACSSIKPPLAVFTMSTPDLHSAKELALSK